MTENERMTHKRASGIKSGYWSPNKKEELVQRLAAYEDTGLEPREVQALAAASRRSDDAAAGWISVKDKLPPYGQPVIVCRPYSKDQLKVEQGCLDLNGWWRVYGTRTKRVTHWMPLPQPPKEVSRRDQG